MDIAYEAQAFARSLRAAGRSEQTITTYLKAIRALETFMATHEMKAITRPVLEAFLADELTRLSRQTVHQHHASLRVFFRYAAKENDEPDPTHGLQAPSVPLRPPDVLSHRDLRSLLAVCAGRSFEDRRDLALLSLFIDTGIRRGEMAGIQLADLDLGEQTVLVTGKTGTRGVPYGTRTAERLDRYLRVRRQHRLAELPALWLGAKGPLSVFGVEDIVARRGKQAGIRVHPHLFRHTFAHLWLDSGGNEGDLQRLAGWRSGAMLQRYGASAASARARRAYLSGRSPVDRLDQT